MSTKTVTIDELQAMKGQEIGVSSWMTIDQERINGFADVTDDHQFIHIDEARAKAETPFGGTIAHGFLTLSLLVPMADEVLPEVANRRMGVNYGLDKLRFLAPVRSGAKVRGRFSLDDVKERGPGQFLLTYGVTIEIEGAEKPALLATWLAMTVIDAAAA